MFIRAASCILLVASRDTTKVLLNSRYGRAQPLRHAPVRRAPFAVHGLRKCNSQTLNPFYSRGDQREGGAGRSRGSTRSTATHSDPPPLRLWDLTDGDCPKTSPPWRAMCPGRFDLCRTESPVSPGCRPPPLAYQNPCLTERLRFFPKALKSNTYVAEKLNCLELFHARPDARFEALLRLWVSNRWRIDRPRSCLEPAGFNHHVSKHVQDRQPERRQQARTSDRSERDLHLTAF